MGLDLDVLDLEPLLSIGLELVLDKLLFLLWPPLPVMDHRLLELPLFLPPSILLLPTYLYIALAYASGGSGSKYLLRASASRSRKPGSGGSRSGSSPPVPGTAATGYGYGKEGLDKVVPLPLLLLGQKQLDHRLRLVEKLLLLILPEPLLALLDPLRLDLLKKGMAAHG